MRSTRIALVARAHVRVFFFIVLVSTAGKEAGAIPAPIHMKPGNSTTLLRAGAVTGGNAGREYSLLAVRSALETDSEKFVLQYGDQNGQPLSGEAGYHHLSLDRDGRRVVIDLAQVSRTAIDPKQLQAVLAKSKLVASSDMTMDPQDGSTNITLSLRAPAQLVIESTSGQNGRVAFRLIPAEGRKK